MPCRIEESIAELLKNRGKQFDPSALDAFLEVVKNAQDLKKKAETAP